MGSEKIDKNQLVNKAVESYREGNYAEAATLAELASVNLSTSQDRALLLLLAGDAYNHLCESKSGSEECEKARQTFAKVTRETNQCSNERWFISKEREYSCSSLATAAKFFIEKLPAPQEIAQTKEAHHTVDNVRD